MIQPWKFIREEIEYENAYVKVIKRVYEMPDGRQQDYFIRDGVGDVASIVALTKEGKFLLAREFRPGPGVVMDELPGGMIDHGEESLAGAMRELLEETGYTGKFVHVTSAFLSAYSMGKKHCYVSYEAEKTHDTDHDHNEFIEVVLKSPEDFQRQLELGDLTDLDSALLGWKYLKEKGLI